MSPTRFLHDRPLLMSMVIIIIGIIAGRHGEISSYTWGIATLVLLVITALPWRHGWLGIVPVVPMLFCLGALLITINDERHPPRPYLQQEEETTVLSAWAEGERSILRTAYAESGMTGTELAIAAAMTLGEKGLIDRDTKEVYSITGAAHIFALSGMHMTIIFTILLWLTSPLRGLVFMGYRWRRIIIMAVVLSAIWGYVILVGGHASVMRAAVMLTLYGICKVSTRMVKSIDVLILTIAMLLVCRPQWLFSVSFQMSAMAMLGIVMLYRPIHDMVQPRLWILRWAWGLLVLSLTAQIGTAPLIAYYFHRFSCYGLLTNYIVSPLAIVIISLALCILLLTMLSPASSLITSCGASLTWIIHTQNTLLERIARLSYSSLDDINISAWQVILIYIIIAALCFEVYLIRKGEKYKIR